MFSWKLLPGAVRRYGYAFTWNRAWNFSKILVSFGLSRLFRRDIRLGQPCVLMIEPTSFCNLRCPLCPSGNDTLGRGRGNMALEHFHHMLDQAAEHVFLLMLWNQGEPFLHRNLLDMVRYARSKRIPTITSTNVHFIRTPEEAEAIVSSGLDEIIVSLDGVTPESYARYRVGGDFEKVVSGIRLLAEAKGRLGADHPVIHLQFILMKHNEGEIAAARGLARRLGADRLSLKTAQVYTREEAEAFLPSDERHSRYRYDAEGLVTKAPMVNSCKHLWYSTVVNWDGSVSPCCFDKDGRHRLGQAGNGRSLAGVWEGDAYQAFRNRILSDRASIPMCHNCSEGLKGQFFNIEEVSK
jgi:MoaA/NifB/PqqE/SkfB family radical SAM enzyme